MGSSAPCTIMAANQVNDDWSTPSSWYQDRVPGPSDVACLGDRSMSVSGDVTVAAVLGQEGDLGVSGQLTLTSTSVASSVSDLYVTGTVTPEAGVTFHVANAETYSQGYAQIAGGTIGGPGTFVIDPNCLMDVITGTTAGQVTNNGDVEVDSEFNLGGYFTNNGLIFGDGNIESTATPPPTLTDAASGVMSPDAGGGTMGMDALSTTKVSSSSPMHRP